MYQRAGTSSGGGGNAQYKEGTFQSSASANTVVDDVGFQPDYLYIESLDRTATYYFVYMYTSETPNDKLWRYYTKSGTAQAQWAGQTMATADTTRGTLVSIDSNGFTFGRAAGNANYKAAPECRYVAVKWS